MLNPKLSYIVLAASALALACSGAVAQERPAASAVAGGASPPISVSVSAVDTGYLLGDGDVVDIGLVGRADFGSRARIGSDGMILLPLVGSIKAADRTVLELSDDIRKALIKGGFYSDPVVRAEVVGISSRYVTVLGSVGSPGLMPLDRAYRLSEILAKIGGRTAGGVDYVLLTKAKGGPSEKFLIAQLASAGPDQDPIVQSGDKIYIPSAETEVFFISGQVNSPGNYPVTDKLTVRMAIARGGGVGENGSEKKVKIVRDGKTLKGVKLEDPVMIGDVITVGERLF